MRSPLHFSFLCAPPPTPHLTMRLTLLWAASAAALLSLTSAAEPSSAPAPKSSQPGFGPATGACAFGSAT